VPVGADTAKLNAAIAASAAKVAALNVQASKLKLAADSAGLDATLAAAKAKVVALSAEASDLKINADATALTAKIAALQAQQVHLGDAMESMTSDVDIRAASTKILALGAEIKFLQSQAYAIKLSADANALDAAIVAAKAKVAALEDQAKTVKIDADITALTAKLVVAKAELNALQDKKLNLNVDTAGIATATTGIAALGAAAFTAGGWFGFLSAKIPLFGTDLTKVTATIFNSVSVWHLASDAILEVAAVVIPASVALASFGVAASSTVNDIAKTQQAFFTITTAFKGLGATFPGLNSGLQNFTDSVKPQVYVLFGEALDTINKNTGVFQGLAKGAGQVLDNLGARAANALGSGGLTGLVAKGVSDLQLLGNIIGNVFGIFGNLLKSLPGYANLLFSGLQAVTGALEAITASRAVQFFLELGLALHGAILWGGLAVTAILLLQAPLLAVGKWVATATLELGLWITEMILANGAAATFAVAMAPIAAINPFVWVAVAIGGLVALTIWLSNTKTAAQQSLDSINKLADAATSFLGVNQALSQGLQQTNAQLSTTPKYIEVLTSRTQGLVQYTKELNPAYAGLTGNVKAINAEYSLQTSRLGELNKITGSAANTQADLQAIGVKGLDVYKLTEGAFNTLKTEVKDYADATAQLAGFQSGPAAAAQNALTNMYLQETLPAIQKITQAEDNLINVVTGGEQGFIGFQQAIGQISSDTNSAGAALKGLSTSSSWASLNSAAATLKVNITGLGKTQALTALKNAADQAYGSVGGLSKASLTLSGDFYNSVIPAAQKMFSALQQQQIDQSDLTKVVATSSEQMLAYAGNNKAARSVIVDLINNALSPGTVTLQSLNSWVGKNSVSLDTMNGIVADSTIKAGKLTGALSSVLTNMQAVALFQAHGGQAAWNTFSTDLTTGQTKSAAFVKSTQDVIAQLLVQTNGSLPAAKKAFEDYVTNGLKLSISTADTLWQNTLPALAGKITGSGTAALQAGGQIASKFTAALKDIINVSPGLSHDVQTFANDIVLTGNASSNTQGARAKLIADLKQAGLSSQTATALVQGLQDRVDALHGKTVPVDVALSGGGELVVNAQGLAARVFKLTHLAAGGKVTGGTPGKDSVLGMLMPGEVVVPAAMVKGGAVDHLRGKLPGFAAGGLVDAPPFVGGTAGDTTGSWAGTWVQEEVASFIAAAKAAAATAAAGTPVAYSKVAGVTQWEPDVARVLSMLGLSQADLPTVMAQILTESGGNPNAINLTDINAQQGDPSKGLMQVIAPTFAAYRNPGLSSNIYDPLANIYAGVNYAIHRYGNPGWLSVLGHGHGYALGGLVGGRVFDSGGTLNPGPNLVWNQTGRAEPVVPAGAAGGGTTVIEAHLHVHGPVGSQAELQNWLVTSIRQIARTKAGGNVQRAFGR
jgi:hypothetical protein